jgi:hypothetical protein
MTGRKLHEKLMMLTCKEELHKVAIYQCRLAHSVVNAILLLFTVLAFVVQIMSSPTAAAAAAEPRSPREVEIPSKFQCRLGTRCLTVNAKYDAWKERTALRAKDCLLLILMTRRLCVLIMDSMCMLRVPLLSVRIGFALVGISCAMCLLQRGMMI